MERERDREVERERYQQFQRQHRTMLRAAMRVMDSRWWLLVAAKENEKMTLMGLHEKRQSKEYFCVTHCTMTEIVCSTSFRITSAAV